MKTNLPWALSMILLAAACRPQQAKVPAAPTPSLTTASIPTTVPAVAATDVVSTPTLALSPDELARYVAETGVTHNDDWTPYTQEIDGVKMALVPAGCFMMGTTDEQADYARESLKMPSYLGETDSWLKYEWPAHEVCINEPFWIDVYEVTQEQFREFGGIAGRRSDAQGDKRPRDSVTWYEADTLCKKRGVRLPTQEEWEYAARGPDALIFPWGNEFDADKFALYGGLRAFSSLQVGSRPGDVSWVGAYDLSGNLKEWVADWSDIYSSGTPNPFGPRSGYSGVVRGGSWDDESTFFNRAATTRPFPFRAGRGIGFRCARPYMPMIDLPTPTATLGIPTPTPTSVPSEVAYQLAKTGVTRNTDWTPYIEEINGVLMALVPAGCFQMGSTDEQLVYPRTITLSSSSITALFEDEQPAHQVCFEKPFWIDVDEVTQEQFGAFVGVGEPSHYKGSNRPKDSVSWRGADAFCKQRGMRLLTEAEWEYAARGPDGLVFPWGNEFIADNVVYEGNSDYFSFSATSGTRPVRSRPGGVSWVGVYDLSGNVAEWVADWYGPYPLDPQINPTGPETGSQDFRVVRGGSHSSLQTLVRAAARQLEHSDVAGTYIGVGAETFGIRCGRDASDLP